MHSLETTLRFPGVHAKDARTTVTLREAGTPWPLHFHFLTFEDDDGEIRRVNVGFEIGDGPVSPDATVETIPERLDPVTVRRIADRYLAYLSYAEQHLVIQEGGREAAIRLLRGSGRKPARLTTDFFRLIAAEFETRRASGISAPLQSLADAYHVDKSTASKWIKRARELGYVKEASDGI